MTTRDGYGEMTHCLACDDEFEFETGFIITDTETKSGDRNFWVCSAYCMATYAGQRTTSARLLDKSDADPLRDDFGRLQNGVIVFDPDDFTELARGLLHDDPSGRVLWAGGANARRATELVNAIRYITDGKQGVGRVMARASLYYEHLLRQMDRGVENFAKTMSAPSGYRYLPLVERIPGEAPWNNRTDDDGREF